MTGLGYNGVDKDGKAKWDGLKNIRITKYFTGYYLEVRKLQLWIEDSVAFSFVLICVAAWVVFIETSLVLL